MFRQEMASYTLPSWVNSVAACPSQLMTDGCDIVVGCVNRTVHGLRVNVCWRTAHVGARYGPPRPRDPDLSLMHPHLLNYVVSFNRRWMHSGIIKIRRLQNFHYWPTKRKETNFVWNLGALNTSPLQPVFVPNISICFCFFSLLEFVHCTFCIVKLLQLVSESSK